MFDDFEVIHSYSRKQAIEDGVLVDVSEIASEAGFTIPVAITASLYHVLQTTEKMQSCGQSFEARLWDVLFLLHIEIKKRKSVKDRISYKVTILNDDLDNQVHELHSVIGPGDDWSPVLTIGYKEDF